MLKPYNHLDRQGSRHSEFPNQRDHRNKAKHLTRHIVSKRDTSEHHTDLSASNSPSSSFFGPSRPYEHSSNLATSARPTAEESATGVLSAASHSEVLKASSVTPTPAQATAAPSSIHAAVPSASQTSSLRNVCLGSTACVSTLATSTSSASPTSIPNNSGAQQFFASLGSSPGSILFTCLVGIAILGITLAIVSFALRRWCNRRRKSSFDEDTWRFLDTPKEFVGGPKPNGDALSAKSSENGFEATSDMATLHPTLGENLTPSHPFSSHMQQQSQQSRLSASITDYHSTPQFHQFIGFGSQQPQRMSCFIDDKSLSWVNNSIPQPSMYNGVLLAPYGTATDPTNTYQRPCGVPEQFLENIHTKTTWLPTSDLVLSTPDAAYLPQCESHNVPSRLAYTPSQQARARATTFVPSPQLPRSIFARTRSMLSNTRIGRHPLSREISIASSTHSTTVETLRERVKDQHTDLRANLIGAIQRDKDLDNDLLESLDFSTSDLGIVSGREYRITLQPSEELSKNDQPAMVKSTNAAVSEELPRTVHRNSSVLHRSHLTALSTEPMSIDKTIGSCYSIDNFEF